MRDERIETLRGLALLLVLAHHAESAHWLDDYLTQTVRFVMMPLFAAISGYLLGLKPVSRATFERFIHGKIIRIGMPFASCMALMYILLAMFPKVFSKLYPSGFPQDFGSTLRFFMVHPQTYWFLQSILVIFVVVGFADSCRILSSRFAWLLSLAGSSLLLLSPFEFTGWMSMDGVQFLLPTFLLGLGYGRFNILEKWGACRGFVIALAFLFMGLFQMDYFFGYGLDFSQGSLLGDLGSLLLTSALFFWGGTVSWLAMLGRPSFGIYLFHRLGWVIGMFIIPFSPQMMGLDLLIHLILMLVTGLLVTLALRENPVARMLFLGEGSSFARLRILEAHK